MVTEEGISSNDVIIDVFWADWLPSEGKKGDIMAVQETIITSHSHPVNQVSCKENGK
jgi:hypothetical protein